MEINFVTRGSLPFAWHSKLSDISGANLVIFGFNGLGLVNFGKELDGETECFQDLARLSRELSAVVISGCDTDSYGTFRRSVAIADSGRVIGVSDAVHQAGGEFAADGNFRVYDTAAGKIGVIVSEDIFYPESARVLTLCDADFLVCVLKKIEGFSPLLMARAAAFSNGLPVAVVSDGYAAVSNEKGEIVFGGNADYMRASINLNKNKRFIERRKKGLYKDFGSGY